MRGVAGRLGVRARVLALLAAAGCAGVPLAPALRAELPPRQELEVPFYAQEALQCGPAALAMALGWSGVEATPASLAEQVFTPERQGSLQSDLIGAARRRGRIPYPVQSTASLLRELAAGRPVVVLQNLAFSWYPVWHYAVVIGYDLGRDEIALHSGARAGDRIARATFERTWARSGRWGRVVLPPERLPATLGPRATLAAIAAAESGGALESADRAYRAAAERWPSEPQAQLAVAGALRRAGALRDAEAALRRALALDPDLGAAWNNLAIVQAERGALAAARETLERALARGGGGPWRPTYLRTLRDLPAGPAPPPNAPSD